MTVVMPTRVSYESLGGDNKAKWTIEVQRWDNVVDRPVNTSPNREDIPDEVREAIVRWLEGREHYGY